MSAIFTWEDLLLKGVDIFLSSAVVYDLPEDGYSVHLRTYLRAQNVRSISLAKTIDSLSVCFSVELPLRASCFFPEGVEEACRDSQDALAVPAEEPSDGCRSGLSLSLSTESTRVYDVLHLSLSSSAFAPPSVFSLPPSVSQISWIVLLCYSIAPPGSIEEASSARLARSTEGVQILLPRQRRELRDAYTQPCGFSSTCDCPYKIQTY